MDFVKLHQSCNSSSVG